MSSAGIDQLCFLKSAVDTAIYKKIFEHFMLLSADKLSWDADFIFRTWHLPTLPKAVKADSTTVVLLSLIGQ